MAKKKMRSRKEIEKEIAARTTNANSSARICAYAVVTSIDAEDYREDAKDAFVHETWAAALEWVLDSEIESDVTASDDA